MNNTLSLQFLILVILTCLLSCNPDNDTLTDEQLGYSFYPIHIGDTWIYDCDSILFQKSIFVKADTTHCQLKETIADSARDIEGNLFYNLEIFYRKNDTDSWQLIDNSFLTVTKTNIIRTEFGLDFIKMVFPVLKNKSWNGNIRISQDNEVKLNGEYFKPFAFWNGRSYYYKNIARDAVIGNIQYLKTAEVEEIDYSDDINRIYSTAIYAEHVGPIYKEFWLLSSENQDPSIPWIEKADYGAIIIQTLIKQ